MYLIKKFVMVTWTDACVVLDKKLQELKRATPPLKVNYGWLFEETDKMIKIVHEELLPDEDCVHEYSFTVIPKGMIRKIEVVREVEVD